MRFPLSPVRRCVIGIFPVAALSTLSLLSGATPAAAVEFAPAATLSVDARYVDGEFLIDIEMGNVAGLDTAHFVLSGGTGNASWTNIPYDVLAGETEVRNLTANEDANVVFHITSADAVPAIDYSLDVLANCLPDETIPDATVPVTTVVGSGGGLPSTGSSNWLLTGVAATLLLAGITLTRSTRRA